MFCVGKILFWTNLMIMRRKMMKMDKMENVDFVRQRYATILRGIFHIHKLRWLHCQIWML
jgi:hypothetical protein